MIYIYTDGSSRGNPGPGGYGIIIKDKGKIIEKAQGYRVTTNNRMELLATIVALESLELPNKTPVTIISDSKYVIDAVEKGWLRNWLIIDFKGKKNADLWKRFWVVYQKYQVYFRWIKGHSGHPENERCDKLALKSSYNSLLVDEYYERYIKSSNTMI